MAQKKRYGLLLALGGAPDTPHHIAGLPGFYSPSVPHPVGEGNDLSVGEARDAAKERPDVVRLVEIDADELEEAEDFAVEARAASRNELPAARRDGRSNDDPSRTADEVEAAEDPEPAAGDEDQGGEQAETGDGDGEHTDPSSTEEA